MEVPGLQDLMKHICRNGFEHHAAFTNTLAADVINEAFSNYMGWKPTIIKANREWTTRVFVFFLKERDFHENKEKIWKIRI